MQILPTTLSFYVQCKFNSYFVNIPTISTQPYSQYPINLPPPTPPYTAHKVGEGSHKLCKFGDKPKCKQRKENVLNAYK